MDLLERDDTLHELETLLRDATSGAGRLAFIGGEAGAGKTVLVRRFAQNVAGRANILSGACDPLSTPQPLGPLLDIAAGGQVPAVAASLAAMAPRDQVFRALFAELHDRRRPAVVIVEDVHWADDATLDLLRFLGRRVESARALLLVTYRDDEVGLHHPLRGVIGDLGTTAAVRRIEVSPLSESAVNQLAAHTGIDPAELYLLTGGNPFFVSEVLESGKIGLPPTVRDAVLARVSRLTARAGAVLEAASVIGGRIDVQLLLSLVPGAGDEPIDEGLAAGVLRVDGDQLAFRHEIAREATYESIAPYRRVGLHRSILAVLEEQPVTPDDLALRAHHGELAGDRDVVLRYAPEAARRAASLGAHRAAAAQYERALRFAGDIDPLAHLALLDEYSEECFTISRLGGAVSAREEAIEICRAIGDPRLEAWHLANMARPLVNDGRNAEAERALARALELLAPLPPGREHARTWMIYSMLHMLAREPGPAIEWGNRALELAEHLGETLIVMSAGNAVGTAMIVAGDLRGVEVLQRSIRLALEAGEEAAAANYLVNLGSGLGEMFELRGAERFLDEAIALSENRDMDTYVNYARAWRSLTLLYLGDWEAAGQEALSVLGHDSVAAITRIMASIALGRVRARRGDPEVAPVLDEALTLASATQTLQRLAPTHAARAEQAWLRGDARATGEEARAVWDLAVALQHPWFVGEFAFWRWRSGEDVDVPGWVAEPFRLQIAGDYRGAAALWEARACPYEAARALADSTQEDELRRVLEMFERLGARPAAAATARRLREIGARGIPRGPRPSTRSTPGLLTRREVEVVRLAAEGLRNAEIAERLFVTPKTVDHHLSSAMAKLDVHSRHEAARAAARLGLLDESREVR